MGANDSITQLTLFDVRLNRPETAKALAASLRANATLRNLHLEQPKTGDWPHDGIRCVFDALSGCEESPSLSNVTSLKVDCCELYLPACEALGRALARSSTKLEELRLHVCDLTPASVVAIADALVAAGQGSRLRHLDLSGAAIDMEGASAVTPMWLLCLSDGVLGPPAHQLPAAAVSCHSSSWHQ